MKPESYTDFVKDFVKTQHEGWHKIADILAKSTDAPLNEALNEVLYLIMISLVSDNENDEYAQNLASAFLGVIKENMIPILVIGQKGNVLDLLVASGVELEEVPVILQVIRQFAIAGLGEPETTVH